MSGLTIFVAFLGYLLVLPCVIAVGLALVFPREAANALLAYDIWRGTFR